MSSQSSFTWELLEPRVLLSGSALASVAAHQVEPLRVGSVSSESAAESSAPASQNLSYDPATAVNDIFGDAGAQTSPTTSSASQPTTAPPPDSQNGQTSQPGSEANIQSPEQVPPAASESSPPIQPFDDSTVQPTTSPRGSSTAEEMVETLHAANGPPVAASPLVQQPSPHVLSPGNSPGTMTLLNAEVWSGGEQYIWEISQLDGNEGAPPGWDLIDIHNTLQITATPGNKFHIYITSLDLSNNPNPVAAFLSSESYSWRIARTTGGIKGFDRAVFDLDPTGFQNSLGGGEFVVDLSSDEKDLILRFKPNPSYTILDQPAWNEEGPFDLLHSHNTLLNSTNPVIGAVQAIALDPANPSVAFLGSVGGGIWETTDLTDPSPVWEPLGKNLPSLAITSLALSPFDKGSNPLTMGTSLDDLVLFAGTGLSSSAGKDGVAAGMFRSKDGGMTWEQVGDFAGQKIVSIAASKLTAKLLFATTIGPLALQDVVGLYRSTDNGDHWDRLSGNGGLPEGQLGDMVYDPSISGQFYLAMT